MSFLKDFDHLRIQLKDVLSATNNFSSANVIGHGGFGNVYKGEISSPEGRQIMVAFKRLDRRLGQGHSEFWKEVMMLSKYKHKNLITLMHFCSDGDQMILVYEYASRGSLDRYLPTLTWIQRLKISVEIARGLQFLHDPKNTQQRLIHRDIKSGNILLDDNWTAKISDFGLSKVAPANQQHTYLFSDAVGTPGYIDPVYMETGCLTKESDTYSFGVILFEILCGRFCYRYHEGILVPEWRRCYEENRLDEIILSGLKQEMDGGSLTTFSAIAYQCTNKQRQDRPTMAQVLLELEFSLEQQELFENHRKRVGFLESIQQKHRASQVSFDESPGLNFESRVNNKFQDWAEGDNSQPPAGSDEDGSPENLVSVQLLVQVLNTGLEKEQHDAIAALVRLLSDNPSRALAVADIEMNSVDILCRILSSNCSMDVKGNTAELCCLLFANTTIRSTIAAARCVEPLISLLVSAESSPAQHSIVCALDKLADDKKLAEIVAAYGAITPLAGLVCGRSYMLHKASSRVLVKLGKDRPSCKMEMVKAGVVEGTLDILYEAPRFFFASFAELLNILTNDATIAKGPSAAKVVEPLLLLITKPVIGPDSQISALRVLVNILEHPQCRAECTLSSHQVIQPLIPLLDSPAPVVQQLSAELLSHMLLEEHYLKDPISQQVIGPLIRLLGSGIPILQQRAVKALDSLVVTWPYEIAKEGGVAELSNVILHVDPSHELQKSATVLLSSILPFNSEFSPEVPLGVLVHLLGSGSDATVVSALNALEKLGSVGSISVVTMAESGVIEALLYLLSYHRCEENAARLLKFVLTNHKIRETNIAERAVLPLSDYLLDTQTQAQPARLLVTIALGDLFQNETLARSAHAGSACRALVNLLKDRPSEEMKLVAICALKNLVRYSGSNTTVVAEAGGVKIVLDLIASSDTNTSVHAAMLIELVFSTDIIQAYASGETVRAITAAIEKNLCATGTVNDEYIKALNALFHNFRGLRATKPATLSIPHLVTSLKNGSEATQEAALHALFLLSQAWSACPDDVSRPQSDAAADAIPLLQYLIQSGPPRFHEKAKLLLMCLPGTLTVVIKRGSNMNPPWGRYSYSCNLTLGKTPSRQTKACPGPDPQWYERFEWHFKTPPNGQKLRILCMMTGKMFSWAFHKATMQWGKVTIPIDRAVMLGVEAGEYNMGQENKSASDTSKNLEVEIRWSKAP